MATATEKSAAKMNPEAEVRRLQSELDALKKDFAARLSALEERLPKPVEEEEEHIPQELLALIAAAVTSYLGKKVKIRSARLIPTANQWAYAGRAVVQASHNLKR